MDFRLLGALEVSAQGAVAELGPPKQRALLAILLLHAGEIIPVDRLIDLLWGEHPPRTASHSIQIYVSDLRKAIDSLGGKEILTTRPPGYLLNADPVSIDARQFERLVEEGTRKLRGGDRAEGAKDLRAALGLWRGPALSDFTYEEFAQPYIRRFHDLHLDAIEELAGAELEAGQASDVVPMLDAAIREDPLRERSRELLMLALYRSGRHAEALRTYQQLRTQLVEELGLDPSPPLQRMQERILLHDPSLSPPPEKPPSSTRARNPYKGLRPFAESDAGDFFGRDDLVDRLVGALHGGANLVALVGPSGSGKSSAIAAGLIPRLRGGAIPGSEAWAIAPMVPGANPLAEVEAVVAAAATVPRGLAELLDAAGDRDSASPSVVTLPETGRVLLVIDQFEELFTITDEQPRRRFLSAIASAVAKPGTQITVLLALRADYYDRPLLHPEFARVFTPGVVNALPMTANELEAVVVGPAERAGVSVEPALLAELVADAADRPGTLPLLEYALTDLFDQRREPALTLEGYRALGGMRGVLSRSAEAVYGALSADEQRVAMQVFLRLVHLGHGTTESRRRLALADLTGLDLDPVALSKVLETFGSRRLLSFDRDPVTDQATVEVAHESLFREWDRLAGWIERHRAALQRYEALMSATDEWEASGRHPDYLLTGTRLTELERWGDEGTLQLTGRQRAFLAAGLERRRAEQAIEEARAEGERRLVRRARRRLVALGVVVAVVIGAAGYGVWAGVFNNTPRVAYVHSGVGEIDALGEAGFDRAVSDFGLRGEERLYLQGGLDSAESLDGMRELARSGVGLVLLNVPNWPVEDLSEEFPSTNFVWPFVVEGYPNSAYAYFAENEGAYLAGVAAALKSKTGTIGYIGGHDSPFIWTWHAGYEAGARSVNPSIEILSAYLGAGDNFNGFHDPSAAELQARLMFEDGADVIFHAAGDSGVGVFEAAAELSTPERHLWAIGVDTDQFETVLFLSGVVHPDQWRAHILTSVLKRVDVSTYEFIADFARGEFHAGRSTFDLKTGGMDISYSGHFIAEFASQIEAARQQIIAEQITVPCIPTEREAAWVELAREQGWDQTICRN